MAANLSNFEDSKIGKVLIHLILYKVECSELRVLIDPML